MIIAFIQVIFTLIFYGVTIPIYNGYLQLGYSTVYTMMPVFSIVLDEDVDQEVVNMYPKLYETLQKGRSLNAKTFLIWTFVSLFQASVIMLVSMTWFSDSFVNIVTITFSALICIEILNVFTEVKRMRTMNWILMFVTIVLYFVSIIAFRSYI